MFGFKYNVKDHSLFIYSKGKDVLITGNGSEIQRKFLKDINTELYMKDLGQMEYFWGIQAKFHDSWQFLS